MADIYCCYHIIFNLLTLIFIKLQNFLVDIKGPALAFLPVLAFEGGTRRNIPKFEVHGVPFDFCGCIKYCNNSLMEKFEY